ncbi:MAG: PAS domain-containing sensor histidine kinase [Sulfurimonadaceae bacterium]
MKHLIYDYTDLTQLQEYYNTQIAKDQKVIVQLHTSEESIVNEVYSLLMQEGRELQIIPVLQKNVKTKLYMTIYPNEVTIPAKENFLEHDLYKAIIDSTKEGFWLLDEELNIISINHSFANMLGYEESELLGRRPYELLALVNEQQAFCEAKAGTVNTSTQRTYELTFVTKKGREFHTIVNATTINLPEHRVRTFAFITDISEQKELEQTLIEQQRNINELNTDLTQRVEAEVQANRKKDHIMYQQARLASMGEMVANIAHQWRQPLNIIALIMQEFYISGQLGTLDREKLEKEYARANSVLQYMSNTIDDFRTFFRHNDEVELFYVNSAIDSVMTLVSKTMEHNNIDIIMNIEDEIAVFGHKNEFVQALINLINNAREAIAAHTKSGVIKIKAYTDGSNIKITVQDNGGGIHKKDIEQIFEPYFTTKHQTQGTGLGLYMSHQIIVSNMNGSIYAENREEGTCFYISLPKGDQQAESIEFRASN